MPDSRYFPANYTVFAMGVDRSAIGTGRPHSAVILSPSAALRVNSAKDLLLYAGIVRGEENNASQNRQPESRPLLRYATTFKVLEYACGILHPHRATVHHLRTPDIRQQHE